ncbi:uncharacterized protein EV420DRAFT_1573831 [Desarmillaria tabescens]|uniref:Uncharacterized protein n=1 Tax=Armillaria tabescens TaxID=1929756 RepID=A0AA39JKV4_ARMTA|nr:uncharacterized protein EV420DRAFT_1573831 [Desarmillaria tabescens]KAK0444607.1 hypothetical protein EV420DRAFT_1573831 [Desarmillaria tabescens]
MALSLASAYFIALGLEILLNGTVKAFRNLVQLITDIIGIMKKKKTNVIIAMTVLNSIMWALATSHMAVSFRQNFLAFLKQHAAEGGDVLEDNSSPTIYSQLSLESINIVIGDSIVIWRAWTLWSRKTWVITAAVGIVRAFATAPPRTSLFNNPSLSSWAIAFIASTLVTNVWATSLVAYRTWSHNKIIREITGEGLMDRFRRQNGVMALLIESGVFYSTTWVLFIAIIAFICGNNGVYIVVDMLSQLTAIYPTLIITLVCLQSTLEVAISTFDQTTQTNPEWAERSAFRRRRRNGPSIVTGTSMAYPMQPMKIRMQTTTHTSTSGQQDFGSTAEELAVDGKPLSISGDTGGDDGDKNMSHVV